MPRRRARLVWLVGAAVAVAALVGYLVYRFPDAINGADEQARLVHSVLLLTLVGGSLLARRRIPAGHALQNALIWISVGAVVFVGYSYRFEAVALKDRFVGELLPHRGIVQGGAISFRVARGGHFVVEANVNGIPIRFLVDTGASDVTLRPADALRLGFDLSRLAFNRPYRTANGIVFGAPVRLERVTIGPITLADVGASVNGAPMARSLLGMSFLGRLSAYEVSRGTLTLKP